MNFINLISVVIGIILGLACIYPDNYYAPLCVFLVLQFSFFFFTKISSVSFFFVGLSFHLTAMWWLWPTMQKFGGMPSVVAFFLMFLHSVLASLQFYFARILSKQFTKLYSKSGDLTFCESASFVFIWTISELFFPRLFPWGVGNFFIYVRPISAYGEIVGIYGVSFLVLFLSFLLSELIKVFLSSKGIKIKLISSILLVFIVVFCFGDYLTKINQNEIKDAEWRRALVVQGNLSIEEKGRTEFLQVNLAKYTELSKIFKEEDFDFIVWPESVVSSWFNRDLGRYLELETDPFFEINKPILFGSLAYSGTRENFNLYNAALVRLGNSSFPEFYAKKILMPLGEYVPFANIFPFIREFTPIQKDFSKGDVEHALNIDLGVKGILKVAVSICYEDLIPSLNKVLVKSGADVLINLTNDAWYGNTAAPYQHDLLARFRAIETRRFLIRSTNTGLTTLVDSSGRIIESYPMFAAEARVLNFPILKSSTWYVKWGDYSLYGLLIIFVFITNRISCCFNFSRDL